MYWRAGSNALLALRLILTLALIVLIAVFVRSLEALVHLARAMGRAVSTRLRRSAGQAED